MPGVSYGPRWRGMTLVEVVLVTALLVVIGSMVVPIFTSGFASVRLRRAGDEVISRWASARARAIETGQVQQFRFTPETGDYVVEPWAPVDPEAIGASLATAPTPQTTNPGGPSTARRADPTAKPAGSGTLPEPIVFHSGQIAAIAGADGHRTATSLKERGSEATAPILFFPDGAASDASVTLNTGEQYLRLTLRGLTGVGRASDVLTREELERSTAR